MSDDELVLLSGLDQPVEANLDILSAFDTAINTAIENRDLDAAMGVCLKLVKAAKLSGLGLSRALFRLYSDWEQFDTGDNFTDTVSSYLGLCQQTVDNYIQVAMMLQVAPNREDLEQKNIRDLIPIAKAISQGYEIEDGQWTKLAEAEDFASISQIVRDEIKEAAPRKSGLQLSIDRDGSIWAFVQSERYFVGSLELKDDSSVIQKACARIITSAGILKQ